MDLIDDARTDRWCQFSHHLYGKEIEHKKDGLSVVFQCRAIESGLMDAVVASNNSQETKMSAMNEMFGIVRMKHEKLELNRKHILLNDVKRLVEEINKHYETNVVWSLAKEQWDDLDTKEKEQLVNAVLSKMKH